MDVSSFLHGTEKKNMRNSMPLIGIYPLVNIQKAIENGHRKFVDLPIKNVIFHSYVSLPEGNDQKFWFILINIS